MPRRTVIKAGRQVAKTLVCAPGNLVYRHNGEPVTYRELSPGDRVLAADPSLSPGGGKIIGMVDAGRKPALRVVTGMGAALLMATTHPLRTPAGWVRGGDLRVGDRVASIRQAGTLPAPGGRADRGLVGSLLDQLAGARGRQGEDPRLPREVFDLPRDGIIAFLGGLGGLGWAGETGGTTTADPTTDGATYGPFPWRVAVGVRSLLAKLGVASRILPGFRVRVVSAVDSASPAMFWDTVRAIEPIGEHPCWDIEVSPHHNYIVNGVLNHNSTSIAAKTVIHSACTPFFSTLFITPLFEMVRRFSQNYVRPFIDQSPVKSLLVGPTTVNSVLQRTFLNSSQMVFSFAFMSPDRTRGISADKINFDEIQDLDYDFIPIILETMSGSKYGGIEEYTGTPKSMENGLQKLWSDSSQAEMAIKCHHGGCGHWNIPALAWDLDAMTGPYRDDISFDNPGLCCAKCTRPVLPHRFGRWIHAQPDIRWQFCGLHIPQQIMPTHYGDREKWATVLAKRAGKGNTPTHVYYNEVCGESYDSGSRLITMSELRDAARLPWPNRREEALRHLDEYTYRVLAVDWGGGGQKEVSFTSLAVLGITPGGEIHVLWGHRSLTPHDHPREAQLCLGVLTDFKCHLIAHDYTGAGSLRETFIAQAGVPLDRIINVAYIRAGAAARVMNYKPPTRLNPRAHWQVDKTRSLLLTCNQIKNGGLSFFKWDYEDGENTGLIYDFLALVDAKTDSRTGRDIYVITRDPAMRDDFAQAVNIGCCTLWNMTDKWPNVAAVADMRLDESMLAILGNTGDLSPDDF